MGAFKNNGRHYDKTFTTAPYGALEMHPYPRLRRYFPRWGHCYLGKRKKSLEIHLLVPI